MRFYLGTHEPHWLATSDVPLFVSRRRLTRRPTRLRPATARWALDSGGFTELSQFGAWTITPSQYADEIRRFAESIGQLDWAAPQDWMCEPWILAKTGRTAADHQQLTIDNLVELRSLELPVPVIPVLQGWSFDDYERHLVAYQRRGIDLRAEPLVGLGSVCRRQATASIGAIVDRMATNGLACHGFGVKVHGLRMYGARLASADSLAWSFDGRHNGTCDLPSRCANHRHWAMSWRAKVLDAIEQAPTHQQLTIL